MMKTVFSLLALVAVVYAQDVIHHHTPHGYGSGVSSRYFKKGEGYGIGSGIYGLGYGGLGLEYGGYGLGKGYGLGYDYYGDDGSYKHHYGYGHRGYGPRYGGYGLVHGRHAYGHLAHDVYGYGGLAYDGYGYGSGLGYRAYL